ncbi:hypothetical protein [Bacillus toyonensis]|uniref:hypothetical protein n=1 Tax=Bacillus toyonensis TaxID=155322 RepID=UPI000BEB9E88|nr:hypothetical protein [Bacillus toyonensis]PDY90634.1 hypothetical protein CON67_11475 [Bacillus toyonensis]
MSEKHVGEEMVLRTIRNVAIFERVPKFEQASQYYEYMIKQTLQQLLSYIEHVELGFKDKIKNGGFIEEKKMSTGERIEHLKLEKVEECWKYEREFPQIARYSFVTSIYSYTEEWTLDTCRKAEAILGLSASSLTYLHSAKKALESSVKIDFSALQQEWQIIDDFNKVRNCIVHSGGNTNNQFYNQSAKKSQELQDAVGRLSNKGVSIQQDNLYLAEESCAEFIKAATKFFEEIHLQVEQKVKDKNTPIK